MRRCGKHGGGGLSFRTDEGSKGNLGMTHLNPIPATKWGRGVRRTKGTRRPVSALPDNSMSPYARPGRATALPARGDNKAFMLVPHKREPSYVVEGAWVPEKREKAFSCAWGWELTRKRMLVSPCAVSQTELLTLTRAEGPSTSELSWQLFSGLKCHHL